MNREEEEEENKKKKKKKKTRTRRRKEKEKKKTCTSKLVSKAKDQHHKETRRRTAKVLSAPKTDCNQRQEMMKAA